MDDRRLGHAEAAEGARGRLVGVERPGGGVDVGDGVGAGGVDRHPVGHRRAPRGVGAGVEVAMELERRHAAVAGTGRARRHPRGVALGRRGHRFRALVDAAHRALEQPGGERDEGLNRLVELAAEAAAAGAGDDPHPLGRDAQHRGHLAAVAVGGLGRDPELDALAQAPGVAGLGLDVGVLDERGLPAPLGAHLAPREALVEVPLGEATARQHVVGLVGLHRGKPARKRGIKPQDRSLLVPNDRYLVIGDRAQRLEIADQGEHRLAPVADLARRQHRLVLEVGINAEAVAPRDVGRAEHPHQPRVPGPKRAQVADTEGGAGVGRAHRAQAERVLGRLVGAETLGAAEQIEAVDLGHPRPHRRADALGLELGAGGGAGGGGEDGVDDLAVAGAATEHATERVEHLFLRGPGTPAQELGRGHQHAWGADPALRRAVAVEGPLQAREGAVPGQALDGEDVAARDLAQRHQTGANLLAVEQHRAGAAIAGVAADLGADQPELLAEHVGEARERPRAHPDRALVDREGDGLRHLAHALSPSSAPSRESARPTRVRAASRR